MSKKEIDDWLEQRLPNVRKNLSIFTKEEVGGLYHLSTNGKIKDFTPRISTGKFLVNEDLTTPRISTSDCLFGCVNGAFNLEDEFIYNQTNKPHYSEDTEGKYLGGYYIYSFDYEYTVKPNPILMSDTDYTNEYWLVTYNKDTVKYTPKIVGKLFVLQVMYDRPNKENNRMGLNAKRGRVHLCLSIDVDNFKLTNTKSVNKGYYLLDTNNPCYIEIFSKSPDIIISEISESDFKEKKKLNASLLSYEKVKFLSW